MKKLKKINTLSILFLFTMTILSCSKNDDSDSAPTSTITDIYLLSNEPNGPVVYKNGAPIPSNYKETFGIASSIFVSKNDVYITANENIAPGKYIAKYSKNGTITILSDITQDAYAYSIAVSGNDVYVAGYEDNGIAYVAKYWKKWVWRQI